MNKKEFSLKGVGIDVAEQWSQLFTGKYNWLEQHLLLLRWEKENIHGQAEIEIALLGFYLRVYWIWDKKRLEAKVEEYLNKLESNNWVEIK